MSATILVTVRARIPNEAFKEHEINENFVRSAVKYWKSVSTEEHLQDLEFVSMEVKSLTKPRKSHIEKAVEKKIQHIEKEKIKTRKIKKLRLEKKIKTKKKKK